MRCGAEAPVARCPEKLNHSNSGQGSSKGIDVHSQTGMQSVCRQTPAGRLKEKHMWGLENNTLARDRLAGLLHQVPASTQFQSIAAHGAAPPLL
jgi:hypothetical protein